MKAGLRLKLTKFFHQVVWWVPILNALVIAVLLWWGHDWSIVAVWREWLTIAIVCLVYGTVIRRIQIYDNEVEADLHRPRRPIVIRWISTEHDTTGNPLRKVTVYRTSNEETS